MSASSSTNTRGTTVVDDKILRAIVSEAVENVPGTTHIDRAGMQRYPKVDVSVEPATETVTAKATIACVYPSPVTTVAEACRHAIAGAVRAYSGYTCTAVSVVVGTVVRQERPVYLTEVEHHPLEPTPRPVVTAPRAALSPVRTASRGTLDPIRKAPRPQLNKVRVAPRPEVSGVKAAQRAELIDVRVQPRKDPRSISAPKRPSLRPVAAPQPPAVRSVSAPKRPAVRSVNVGKRAPLIPVVKPRRIEPALVSAPKRPPLRKPVRRSVGPVYHPLSRSGRKVQR